MIMRTSAGLMRDDLFCGCHVRERKGRVGYVRERKGRVGYVKEG